MTDLRSDTLTRPTPQMREAIFNAEVGDDVFGEDPTVNRLEAMAAERFGKEAALFVASGTMANQIGVNLHTRPGDEIIVEANSHIFVYEGAAPAFISGVQVRTIEGRDGVFTADQVLPLIRTEDDHFPVTSLVVVENTHNKSGGRIFPLEEIMKLKTVANEHNLSMHLDGARIFNAVIATGIDAAEWAKPFDSLSFCLSKGLGAPVGSLICSSRELIRESRRIRKKLGGGMRQAGIIAAAGIYALKNHVERLKEDHEKALIIAEAIDKSTSLEIDLENTRTNIVLFRTIEENAPQVAAQFRASGILLFALDNSRLRAVTHLDVSFDQVRETAAFIHKTF